MKDIDFLPPQYHVAQVERQSQIWRSGLLLVFSAVIGTAFVGQHGLRRHAEAELAAATVHFDAAVRQQAELARRQQQLAFQSADAELWTYLRHPWPRSRILKEIVDTLPEKIAVERIRLVRESLPRATTGAPESAGVKSPAGATPALTPAQLDLQKLRAEGDGAQFVLVIDASAAKQTDVHNYVARLAASSWFAKTDLASLQRTDSPRPGMISFCIRLVIVPGYGMPRGPSLDSLAQIQGSR